MTLRRIGSLLFCLHPRSRATSDKTSGPTATRGSSYTARPLPLPRFLYSFRVGLAENPAKAALSCRQIGPIRPSSIKSLKDGKEVFSARASAIFKSTQVVRFFDEKRSVLVCLTYTDRIVDGSPENSISIVPVRW